MYLFLCSLQVKQRKTDEHGKTNVRDLEYIMWECVRMAWGLETYLSRDPLLPPAEIEWFCKKITCNLTSLLP